ncbi:MAG: DegT/DnrJ/EryC1/StrS aminotransferase family protein [Chromatiaceae bacterium]
MSWKIALSVPQLGPEETAAVQRVLASTWLTMGEETQAFEGEFARFLGVQHAIACASGTAALHLAMLALGIGPGSRVIQPAVNFVAAANMTMACGATPVFADILGLDEPTLSPRELAACLAAPAEAGATATSVPTALILMHYGGYPCRMDEILDLCGARGVPVIEDACHSPGGHFQGTKARTRRLGSLGEIGCFSFFSNKNLATGEGGMVVTDRDDLAATIRSLRSHGMTSLTWDRDRGHAATYDVTAHGFNYRIDELRSAIGREQLRKLAAGNQRRRDLTRAYWEALATLEERGWVLPFRSRFADGALEQSACHLVTLVAPDPVIRWQAADRLRAAGIQSSLHYPLVPSLSAFASQASPHPLPLATAYAARTLTLPLYPALSTEQVAEVTRILVECQ